MEQALPEKLLESQLVKFPHFIEPKCLLSHSKDPVTSLCPEPEQACACLHIPLLGDPLLYSLIYD